MHHADRVFFDVFEKELKAADHMGSAAFDLHGESLTDQWMKDMWIHLQNSKGEATDAQLQIVIHFVPTTTVDYLNREASVLYAQFKANIQKRIQKAALNIIDQAGNSAADAEVKKASLFRN
ncbi:hypothetical protein HDU97_003246 [Phlyctochytrium planicorne]|nr:hypothetical protein HDU97_003246 [Phlyctochytrium planicorne]